LGGASYGAVVATLVPHDNVIVMGVGVAAALAPLALLAAVNPSFRVAPITAMIVLLGNVGIQQGPVEAAFYRTIAVTIGSIIGLVVALTVFPSRAHGMLSHAANRMLGLLARLFTALMQGLAKPVDRELIGRLNDDIRVALTRLETVTAEANRERRHYLSDESDPAPFPRTLRRLRNDLIMVGRCTAEPLPPGSDRDLNATLAAVSETMSAYLRDAGHAIERRQPPPDFTLADEALAAYAVAAAALRDSAKDLPREAAERISALNFAFEQLRRDCKELSNRIQEFARPLRAGPA